jgi:hypothetical protein
VTVTVAKVNAQTPVIKVHPVDGAYMPGETAQALSVEAESPESGTTLSYQWHRMGENDTAWEPISGATTDSYTPPTATAGVVYYYVAVTSFNPNVDGEKDSLPAYSKVATVTVASSGERRPVFALWATDDSLISSMEGNVNISRSLVESFALVVANDLTNLQWSINNVQLPGPRGASHSIVIEAADYPIGSYTLGLYAEKGQGPNAVPYSLNITFVVDN